MKDTRVPVTLLTGFLGAGKTTVLNRILSHRKTEALAIIVNEFGEIGLDHDLIEHSDEEVILMQSGCLCCSVRGDLSDTLARLLARRDVGRSAFDRVVIETTGMAAPGPILQTFKVDPFLSMNARVDGVVTVVDAVNVAHTLDTQFEAVTQVALADLILLTKTDLVTPAEALAVTERLSQTNPTADVVRPDGEAFVAHKLWGLTGLRAHVTEAEALAWTTPKSTLSVLNNLSGFAPKDTQMAEFRGHDSDISSISIILEDGFDETLFDRWFDTLIAFKGQDILRVKGLLFLDGVDTPFAFHGVQRVFDPPVPLTSWRETDRRSRLVIIGRNLNRAEIEHSLNVMASVTRPKVDAPKVTA